MSGAANRRLITTVGELKRYLGPLADNMKVICDGELGALCDVDLGAITVEDERTDKELTTGPQEIMLYIDNPTEEV